MAKTDYISYSPSAVDTFANCETRFWFDSHADGSGVMPTDNTAASVSRAIHDALMDYHRQLETLYTAGQSLDDETATRRLDQLLDKHLRQQNMDRLDDPVARRLASTSPGLSRAALLIRDGMKDWSIDPDDGQMLVWAEAPLYSESEVAGVKLKPGFMSRTRPDIVGIRPSDDGTNRVLIRDYKARGIRGVPSLRHRSNRSRMVGYVGGHVAEVRLVRKRQEPCVGRDFYRCGDCQPPVR